MGARRVDDTGMGLLLLLIWFRIAFVAGRAAVARGHAESVGQALGLLLGPAGWLVATCLPDRARGHGDDDVVLAA